MHSTQTWASTRLCEMMGQMTVMDQQHKLARPAQLTTTYQPNAFSKFYVYRIDCNFRFIKIPARSEGTCVADAEANYFSSFAGQKNYVIANLVAPILLELGKAARKEDTRGRKWGKKIEAPSEVKDSPLLSSRRVTRRMLQTPFLAAKQALSTTLPSQASESMSFLICSYPCC